MKETKAQLVATGTISAGDTDAIKHLRQAIGEGKHWYLALLGAMGLWTSASEYRDNCTCNYLIENEAFDWLLLAERLCETVDGCLPQAEQNALLFSGIPPLQLDSSEVKKLIGSRKYSQYLNYFYGVTVEESLQLVVQEEIDKEKRVRGFLSRPEPADEPFRRIYGYARSTLLKSFRKEKRYSHLRNISITEMKEFTYWLFKFRLRHCEKARIASDTAKALQYLKRQWSRQGVFKVLAIDMLPGETD